MWDKLCPRRGRIESHMEKLTDDRLDAWYDGSAICVIAIGSHGDPLDLGESEVEAFIAKLEQCLRQARNESEPV